MLGEPMIPITASTSSTQIIVTFLCQNPNQSFYSGEIAEKTSLSKGGTNQSLRELAQQGILKTEKKGHMIFYSADLSSPSVRQFKIFQNVTTLEGIVNKLRPFADRVVLFGSCAKGEDTSESDVDLLVIGRDKDHIRSLIPETKAKRKIQLLLKTPQEYVQLENKEPVFFKEIQQGVVLWQKQ